MFIKIGNHVINLPHVGYANLNDDGRVILVIDGVQRLQFEGEEAELLRELFGGGAVESPDFPGGFQSTLDVRDLSSTSIRHCPSQLVQKCIGVGAFESQ